MKTKAWKPSGLLNKLVWAWDTDANFKNVGILLAISKGHHPYELDDASCYMNICPIIPEEHPELFYKGESSDAKR
jgi:hypothetical protein